MFEIVFFGTSAAAPSIHRGLAGNAILAGEHRFLIDCGEGTQRQILRSGIGFKNLNRILLTHGHLDHILGLGGLISTYVRWENIDELEIWGGKATLDRVNSLIYGVVLGYEQWPIKIHLFDLKPGAFIETDTFSVSAFPVTHRGSGNFGFSFQEHTRRPFLVDKAQALGVPEGPERSQLVRGETVTLADGKIVTPDMVLDAPVRGTKLVHVGDTARTDNLREHVADADVLVIEATFLEVETDVAQYVGHITARQAATLARDANVKTLILTHVSRRYREHDIIDEARAVFPGAIVARDLDHYIIKRDKSVEKKARMPRKEE